MSDREFFEREQYCKFADTISEGEYRTHPQNRDDMATERGQMPTSEAQKKACKRYLKNKTTQFAFRLRNDADKDVIERLNSVTSRVDYIRKLVRRDVERDSE